MNTDNSLAAKHQRAKKMMLWFGMISMSMTFAGLTSAYVVSSSRTDWIQQIELPTAFTISTLLMLLSSATFFLSFKSLKQQNNTRSLGLLGATFALALLFIYFQFQGFQAIIDQGYYFTGAQSSITTSFLYVLVLLHLLHLVAGICSVSWVFYNTWKNKFKPENTLGFELALTFWHFLDFLWLYLFLFVSFYR